VNPPPRRPRRRRSSAGPVVLAAAFLAGAVGAGGTAALWSSDGGTPLGAVVSGDLDVELLGPTRWHETSPDVPGTPREVDPAEFLVRPGDTLTVRQQFTTELTGDNMLGRLTVAWAQPPALPAGAAATYAVRDGADDVVVSDVPLGTSATLPDLDTDDDGRTDTFTLEVTLGFADTADRFGPDAAPQVADLGAVVLRLEQARTGEGFSS